MIKIIHNKPINIGINMCISATLFELYGFELEMLVGLEMLEVLKMLEALDVVALQ